MFVAPSIEMSFYKLIIDSVPVCVPLSSAECLARSSIQFKFYSGPSPLWASFSSSFPPSPLLAFPFIIIAKVGVLVIWCLVHHVPLGSFTCHRWVCPVTVDWKCVNVATVEQNNHRKCYTQTAQSDLQSYKAYEVMNDSDWNGLYLY